LTRNETSIKLVEKEISILLSLDHPNINKIVEYGSDGSIVKPSGRELRNLVYLTLDYIPGGIFFDMCKLNGAMGEDAGRFFLKQLIDGLSYLHE